MLLALAWGVRFLAYAPDELGLDGNLSVGLALEPLPRLFTFLARDVHPPFYYLLLKGWLALVGTNYVSARWLGVAAGVLTLAVLYRLLSSLASERGALVAVGLLVLSPAHISASATVRDFGLGLFFSVVSLAAWRALDVAGDRRRQNWLLVVLAGSTGLALATWYFHVLFVGAQLVALLHGPKSWRARIGALTVGVALQAPWAIAALGPLLLKVVGGVTVSGASPGAVSLRAVLADLGSSFAGSLPSSVGSVVPPVAWLLLLAWGFAQADSQAGPRRTWAVVGFSGAVLGLVAVYGLASRWAAPSLLGRYGLVVLPWAALAQAWAFSSSPVEAVGDAPKSDVRAARQAYRRAAARYARSESTRMTALVPIGLAALVLIAQARDLRALQVVEAYPWDRHLAAVPELALLESNGRPGDVIVFTDLARAGQYALRNRGQIPSTTIHIAGSPFLQDDLNPASVGIAPLASQTRGAMWLLYDRPVDEIALSKVVELFGANRVLTREDIVGRSVIDRYESWPLLDRHDEATRFGSAITLAATALSRTAPPGGTVYLELDWQVSGSIPLDYTVFAQLMDSTGQKVAQYDGIPVHGQRPTTSWRTGETIVDRLALSVPETAKPGTYRVVVGLYRGTDRLAVEGGGDSATLGPVEVVGR